MNMEKATQKDRIGKITQRSNRTRTSTRTRRTRTRTKRQSKNGVRLNQSMNFAFMTLSVKTK